jgi:hypothetical protein
LWIYNNDNLPQCEACDLLDQLIGFTGDVNISANKADTNCPDNNCP